MEPALRLALFEPDIPQNTAAVLRTCACFGLPCEIIEPCGFVFGDHHMRRVGMDYIDNVALTRHADWYAFNIAYPGRRRILMTTKASKFYTNFSFQTGDILLMGRESEGVPRFVHEAADARLTIPMTAGMRSLNISVSAAIVAAEVLRQLDAFPKPEAARHA